MLPKDFPPENGVYYFLRWVIVANGRNTRYVVKKVRKMVGKNEIPSVGIIDSQSVKTTQKGDPEDMMLARK
ncbi:hypothetical protein HUB92_00555 [Wolbachia endosymbiont of Wiebesia pumilae]|uniref:hypothetical protein n=1 Tax=Wolbachia endosymbiont of Wiebesia pumilae TaxID=2742717 RepID=UPI001AE68627|nr:hypothetical protein [Wolbachia endosymbiont of Wiebesia pumilae]QTP61491.1 hypothetical protein HUB92_00555 [Wolbachia endosymbiont of Wiebesia pumilae]